MLLGTKYILILIILFYFKVHTSTINVYNKIVKYIKLWFQIYEKKIETTRIFNYNSYRYRQVTLFTTYIVLTPNHVKLDNI